MVTMEILFYVIIYVTAVPCSAQMMYSAHSMKYFLQKLNKNLGINSYHPSKICPQMCKDDDSCTSVFWNSSLNSHCRIVTENSEDAKFVPGENYFCKECKSTADLIEDGIENEVIKLENVALNKPTEESGARSLTEIAKFAVDGDPSTFFLSPENNKKQWLMVDLVERFMVAKIKLGVQLKDPLYLKRGGNVKICLVDTFDRNVNPCTKSNKIGILNRDLISISEVIKTNKIKMGRYLVIKKLEKKQILELNEVEIFAVTPVTSYICEQCYLNPNTICDESLPTPTCNCIGNYRPVNGDINSGCRDPCENFMDWNTICIPQDFQTYMCQCKEGYYEIYKSDPCGGCTLKSPLEFMP